MTGKAQMVRTRRTRPPRSRPTAKPTETRPSPPEIRAENVKLAEGQIIWFAQVVDDDGRTTGPPIPIPERLHYYPGDEERAKKTFEQFASERMPAIIDAVRRAYAPNTGGDIDDGIRPSG